MWILTVGSDSWSISNRLTSLNSWDDYSPILIVRQKCSCHLKDYTALVPSVPNLPRCQESFDLRRSCSWWVSLSYSRWVLNFTLVLGFFRFSYIPRATSKVILLVSEFTALLLSPKLYSRSWVLPNFIFGSDSLESIVGPLTSYRLLFRSTRTTNFHPYVHHRVGKCLLSLPWDLNLAPFLALLLLPI